MNSGLSFMNDLIEKHILSIRTSYLAKVESVSGNTARLQPLTTYKAVGGNAQKQSTTSALIPKNIKCRERTITYMTPDETTATMTVLVPDSLVAGDIVYVGVCDRDITYAKNGIIKEATNRHHDINDSVILRYVR